MSQRWILVNRKRYIYPHPANAAKDTLNKVADEELYETVRLLTKEESDEYERLKQEKEVTDLGLTAC